MLPGALIRGYDRRRLRNLLAVIFLALAAPTAFLIWHAYSQLKWEAFYQYRGLAEELTGRIDAQVIDMVESADDRSFADYNFVVVTGDPSANFLQRSPLSAFPVGGDPPGLLGHFQVDTHGDFSSPLLPPAGSDPKQFGIGGDEYASRLLLTHEIHDILADNGLVSSRPGTSLRHSLATDTMTPGAGAALEDAPGDAGGTMKTGSMPTESVAPAQAAYSQEVFDQLNAKLEGRQASADGSILEDSDGAPLEQGAMRQEEAGLAKVSSLQLDAVFQKRSQELEERPNQGAGERTISPSRTKRKEQIALPEAAARPDRSPDDDVSSDLRISTFESEVDPLDFSLLDSGHLVLFRKVWREGERIIQGLLIDQDAFVAEVIDAPFMETALAGTSSLIVAHGDNVIHTVGGCGTAECPDENRPFEGALAYRGRLTAPLDSVELIFSLNRLPSSPGASVLGWVTMVLAIVLVSGFYALYRLGVGQITLARQQQDFVSAVSHELKTPLTSIRMYGEMLREGWGDEEKRKIYYEYIHDESERLSRLISNVLQLANITRNEPQIDLRPIKVGELMRNIESKIADQVARAGFRLEIRPDPEAERATVLMDEDCFAQIVINLVDNAIKFSENAENKSVEIASRRTSEKEVMFSVRDFGPGIPREQMKKVFELFYRPESELTRETVGTGIGLAIVHQLAAAMNGRVDVVNREPGAEFTVTFPGAPVR